MLAEVAAAAYMFANSSVNHYTALMLFNVERFVRACNQLMTNEVLL